MIQVLIAFRLGGPEHIVVIAGDKQLLFTPLPNDQTLPGSVSAILVESEYLRSIHKKKIFILPVGSLAFASYVKIFKAE